MCVLLLTGLLRSIGFVLLSTLFYIQTTLRDAYHTNKDKTLTHSIYNQNTRVLTDKANYLFAVVGLKRVKKLLGLGKNNKNGKSKANVSNKVKNNGNGNGNGKGKENKVGFVVSSVPCSAELLELMLVMVVYAFSSGFTFTPLSSSSSSSSTAGNAASGVGGVRESETETETETETEKETETETEEEMKNEGKEEGGGEEGEGGEKDKGGAHQIRTGEGEVSLNAIRWLKALSAFDRFTITIAFVTQVGLNLGLNLDLD